MQRRTNENCKMCKDVFDISLKMRGCQTYENLYSKDTNSYGGSFGSNDSDLEQDMECSKMKLHLSNQKKIEVISLSPHNTSLGNKGSHHCSPLCLSFWASSQLVARDRGRTKQGLVLQTRDTDLDLVSSII